MERLAYRTWVLCGDSEMAEGSIWEVFDHASHEALDNLIAIIDVNRLGQRGETMLGWNTSAYVRRAEAFGWRALEIDGHDVEEIDRAYEGALASDGQPVAIVARTLKGKGVSAVENRNGFHGKPLEDPDAAVRELGGQRNLTVPPTPPAHDAEPHRFATDDALATSWEVGEKVATRRVFGDTLAALAASDGRIVVLDGEVGNSTDAGLFADVHPERYFEMYIAEQQLVAAAVGLQVRGWVPLAATFAAFFSRAYDFIRMAAVSRADIRLVGWHCGVSIGEDGPSQMALEDIAALRAVQSSTVLYPSCANQTAKLVAAMVDRPGIVYLRTTRAATPALYGPEERFEIGGSRVVRSSERTRSRSPRRGSRSTRCSPPPTSSRTRGSPPGSWTSTRSSPSTNARLSKRPRRPARSSPSTTATPRGIRDAVLEVFADGASRTGIVTLAVREMPTSGTPAELLEQAGIDRDHIVRAAQSLIGARSTA